MLKRESRINDVCLPKQAVMAMQGSLLSSLFWFFRKFACKAV